MSEEYYELLGFCEVEDPGKLALHRSKALFAAVKEAADFTLVKLLSFKGPGPMGGEALVVDITCDGVPSRNPAGIQYIERLALWVPDDEALLVEVLALRKSFPVLMHQNHGTRDGAASLCLYFEPTAAVFRTWTPQRFLRRIKWWLEQSARGELHPADQPVENLFFSSKFELVLPWNLDTLANTNGVKLVVVRSEARPDGGYTFFLEPVSVQKDLSTASASHIELMLDPVVQGFVERDPATIGQLADQLERRGVQLLPKLIAAISHGIGDAGVPVTAAETFVVIIIHIPMVHEPAGEVQRVARRAFLIQGDLRQLGVKVGALQLHDKRYFTVQIGTFLAPQAATEWKTEPVFPMEVLQFPDRAAARKQSSLYDEGPHGVLVGAGSLGSALLNLWARAGWGLWYVIDKDHVKPHNLVRHTAFAQHVGELKCEVVAGLSAAATKGAAAVTPIWGDACDLDASPVQEALKVATLAVDATAALEYPRNVSGQDTLPRHATVFVTPSGNGAVLMLENRSRTIRLRTLEAQYYRAVIRQAWGIRHLEGNLGTYWSGASCRDISVALPYSRISVHASTLAEQVMAQAQTEQACIRVWERDAGTGAVSFYEVAPNPERRVDFGTLSAYFDEGLAEYLKKLRLGAFPSETGGVLLGYHDFNNGAVVIVDAISAPPDSCGNPTSFERGTNGLANAVQDAAARTAGIVGYVGEWHSHPKGQSAKPSWHDLIQLEEIALGMHEDGLPALQLIVGEEDIQVLQGNVCP